MVRAPDAYALTVNSAAGRHRVRTGSGDLGYPIAAARRDGSLLTVHYFTAGDGVTHVSGRIWEP